MYAVDLNEGAEQDYLKLEAFWSEIHKEAIKQGSQNGWSVWKRTPKKQMKLVRLNTLSSMDSNLKKK